jgi:hypothetical protein
MMMDVMMVHRTLPEVHWVRVVVDDHVEAVLATFDGQWYW